MEEKLKKNKEISLKASLKSSDTEEWWDIHFNRPIGFFWAKVAIPLHITPNMITIASIFIGSAGSLMFYYNDLKLNIIGMLLLILANTFDSADGQLARLTGNKTRLGRILDGLAGDIWFFIIYLVLVLRLINIDSMNPWLVWIVAVVAGASHILAASMADYYRNVQLYFAKGEKGSEHDHSEKIDEDYKNTKFFEKPFTKISLFFYRNYTKTQEILSPKLQAFSKTFKGLYPNQAPKEICEEIRQKNLKYMPLTNILQFNTRVAFLFLSIFLNKVWLYFVFDIVVMNAILIYLIYSEEKLFESYNNKFKQLSNIDKENNQADC